MDIGRRSFFATLLAPFIARFLPKPVQTVDPNPGLFGLKYYQIPSNMGSYMGMSRSNYPGSFIGSGHVFRDTLKRQASWHIDNFSPPGSFQKYIEAERRLHA